ncbi:MAG: sugar phosphate isomerase/epimerase [Clostridiales bacterium]|nr:MAG: sugar phosphate isomerase/epimerase [Clostridiales bacterium]
MIIGVSSYSFSQYLSNGTLTQLSAVAKASELGFQAIEFTDLKPPAHLTQLDYAHQIKEEAAAHGIAISAYVVGANLAQTTPDAEIERLKGCVDVAAALGVTFFRHDAMSRYGDFRSFDQALPTLAGAIRSVTEYAQARGIRTMVENHGLICQDSDRIERLVNAVNHPNFGTLVDIGNFLCADEEPAKAVSRVANLAFLVHAKDFEKINFGDFKNEDGYFKTRGGNRLKGVTLGSGCVPVAQCLAILKQAGFNGYVDLEFEGKEDCLKALAEGLAFIQSVLPD